VIPWGFILRIIGPIAIVGLAWLHGYSTGQANANRKWEAIKAEAQAQEQETYRLRNKANGKVTDDYHKRLQTAKASADRAKSDADSLRDLLSRQKPDTTSEPGSPEAPYRELLGECVQRYSDMAAEGDRMAEKLRALQGWATGVCVN
jgi:hypothetical protein